MATKTSRPPRAPSFTTAAAGAIALDRSDQAGTNAASDATASAIRTTCATVVSPAPRPTKAALLHAMVSAPDGAGMAQLRQATGWQAHTVRAALSGLRKAGIVLERRTIDGDAVYRIVEGTPEEASPEAAPMTATAVSAAPLAVVEPGAPL